MQWFRMYSETLNNPKAQKLPGDVFKAWINLLCVTSQCDGRIVTCDISFNLRMSQADVDTLMKALVNADLMIKHDGYYVPKGWDERQFKSDTSAERMKRHRDKKKDAECDVTCNVTVTPPDTDTDTEQNRKKDIYVEVFETFWSGYPKQRCGSRTKAEAAFRQALKRAPVEEILAGLARYAISDEVAKGFAKGAAAWLNDDRWKNDYAKGKQNEPRTSNHRSAVDAMFAGFANAVGENSIP